MAGPRSRTQLLAVIGGTGTRRRSAHAIAETLLTPGAGSRADLTAIGVVGVTAAPVGQRCRGGTSLGGARR